MSTGAKWALGIFIGCALLLLIGGGACVYFVSRFGPEFAERAKKSESEGKSFGGNTDEAGCLKEVLERNKKQNSILGIVPITIFLGTCLKESKPTPGFCDGVPSTKDRNELNAWAVKKCAEAGQSGQSCGAIFGIVAAHCQSSGGPKKEKAEEPQEEPTATPIPKTKKQLHQTL